MSQTRAQLEAWRQQNPELFRGLQQAISRAEGTWRGGRPGYNILFGGGTFGDYSRHPDRVISSPGGYSSAAAGAYQFMPGTYAEAARALGLKDFSPESQDLAMLYKVRQRLMPAGGLAALTKEGALSPKLQDYLAPEWASIPTASGGSAYGQPVKRSSQVSAWFDEGARGSQAATKRPPASSGKQESGLGFLNKFIDLLGITGAMQKLGPRSEVTRPELTTYEKAQSDTADADLLLGLYKDIQAREAAEEASKEGVSVDLQRNLLAAEQAKAQLLAQALGSFVAPKSLI